MKIGRLPEPAQQLVHQYIDVLTSDLEERVARLELAHDAVAALPAQDELVTVEQRLRSLEARADRTAFVNAQLLRTLGLLAEVLARSVAELAAADS